MIIIYIYMLYRWITRWILENFVKWNTYVLFFPFTVCPRSSDPFYVVLYKMGHYFLDKQYWHLGIGEADPDLQNSDPDLD